MPPARNSAALSRRKIRRGRPGGRNGEFWRNEETIATGLVESVVNQIVSKRFAKLQQMQRTKKGAHLLLQTRSQVLDGRLEGTFQKWYPGFWPEPQRKAA
jgi:hypothetical protein